MGERERDRWRNRRRESSAVERKCDFPPLPFPTDTKLSVKNIAYLSVYCRMPAHLVAARVPGASLSDVHLGLAHYYRNRDAIDAEIKREMEFNRRDALGDASLSLPRMGLSSLVEALNE